MNTKATTRENKTKWHWSLRLLFAFAIFVGVLVVIYLAVDQVTFHQYQSAREQFRERFGKVAYEEFIPERPPVDQDAGRIYRYAIGLMADVDEEMGEWALYNALTEGPPSLQGRGNRGEPMPSQEELDRMIGDKMAALDEAFAAVEEARGLERGSIMEEYGPEELMPVLSEARQLARNIAAKAVYEARAGNLEAACRWLESGLHLADTLGEDPALITQMVRVAVVDLAMDCAQQVYNTTDAPLPLSDRYWTLLERVSDPAVYANALASEVAFSMSLETPMIRPMWSMFYAKYMTVITSQVDLAVMKPSLERRQRLDALEGEVESLSRIHVLLKNLLPSLLRSVDAYDRMATRCTLATIARDLRAYKVAHGAFPDILDELVPEYLASVPIDRFSGNPLCYRKAGEGFAVYSVGNNRTDDGGVDDEWKNGDILWASTR